LAISVGGTSRQAVERDQRGVAHQREQVRERPRGRGVEVRVGRSSGSCSMPIEGMSEETFRRIFPALYLGLLFGAVVTAAVAMYFAGFAAFPVGSVTYTVPVIFGYYLLTRRLATVLFVTVAVTHAVLLAASHDVVARGPQWFVMMVLLAMIAVLVGGMVDQSDRLARSEQRAVQNLAEVNRTLEARVAEQVDEVAKLSRLRRFLSPQVADAVLSAGPEDLLSPHRRRIAVFFCDLRGFTAFASRVEPEEVVAVIGAYYDTVGAEIRRFRATVGSMSGDGIMAYVNDPEPCDEPAVQIAEMALAVRSGLESLCRTWQRHGYDLGFGMGLALGHATLGIVGFEGRSDYTALGTVVNLASRLCDEAQPGQILVDQRLRGALPSGDFVTAPVQALTLKGFPDPVPAHELRLPTDGADVPSAAEVSRRR
jgi:class 3 adenylate cyclase